MKFTDKRVGAFLMLLVILLEVILLVIVNVVISPLHDRFMFCILNILIVVWLICNLTSMSKDGK